MSRIEGARHIVALEQAATAAIQEQNPAAVHRDSTDGESIYFENQDSYDSKFNARKGIERGHGRGRGHDCAQARNHENKRKGDLITITLEGVGDVTGVVLEETDDTLKVLVDGEVHEIDKKSGKSRGHRKASDEEMRQGQQMYAQAQAQENQRQQEVQASERRSDAVTENIKISNRKHDIKVAEFKKEVVLDQLEAVERGTTVKIAEDVVRLEQNKSVATQFQTYTPETLHTTLSVSEIINARAQDEELKKS